MAILARGSVTVVDLYDATVLQAVIGSSQMVTQTYNNTAQTYSPNYASTPQELTLIVTKAGTAQNLVDSGKVSNVKWYKLVNNVKTEITSTDTAAVEYKKGTSNSVLVTKTNTSTTTNAVRWTVEGQYLDDKSGQYVTFSASIDLTVVQLAKAAIIPNMYAPDGDFFRNKTPVKLKINADLYKDGSLSNGSKTFKWFAADGTIPSQDVDGGVGWRKITKTSGTTGEFANSGFDASTTGQGVLTVFPDAVVNAQTYKVVITDKAGGTSGTKVTQFLTLRDMDDNMVVTVEGETVIKNSAGSVKLTARVWRAGQELDESGTLYQYRWYKYVENEPDATFGGATGYKTGKILTVGSADVTNKAEFRPEVHG